MSDSVGPTPDPKNSHVTWEECFAMSPQQMADRINFLQEEVHRYHLACLSYEGLKRHAEAALAAVRAERLNLTPPRTVEQQLMLNLELAQERALRAEAALAEARARLNPSGQVCEQESPAPVREPHASDYRLDGMTIEEWAKYANQQTQQAWQPIATAPKDGTGFLVYWPKSLTGKLGEIDRLGGWHEYEEIIGFGEPLATHWMPLPPPPVEPLPEPRTEAWGLGFTEKPLKP